MTVISDDLDEYDMIRNISRERVIPSNTLERLEFRQTSRFVFPISLSGRHAGYRRRAFDFLGTAFLRLSGVSQEAIEDMATIEVRRSQKTSFFVLKLDFHFQNVFLQRDIDI